MDDMEDARLKRFGILAGVVLVASLWAACGKSASTSDGTVTAPAPVPSAAAAAATAAQTPAPTQVPTPEPTPEPVVVTEEMLAGGLVDDYFNDAVFVGDSITQTFRNYCSGLRKERPDTLGTARFLAGVSLNARIASCDSRNAGGVALKYRGRTVSVSEGLLLMEAKRVFILLGVNDLAGKYPDETIGYYETLIDILEEKCGDLEIVVQGVLPVSQAFCKKRGLSIADWNAFNQRLEAMCSERGVLFLDFSAELMDEEGYLSDTLSSDGMFHLNEAANAIWLRALRRFALSETQPDAIFEPAQ